MDIGPSLQNALSGLHAAQANLSVISSNISNAQTPGYSRETIPLQSQILGGNGAGVTVGLTQRQVDDSLARSVRDQDTTTSAAMTTDSYLQQVQGLFGKVNGGNSLGDVFSKFSGALQTLSTTPEDPIAQVNAVSAGQNIVNNLNEMSSGIQQVRASVDSDIASSVSTLNTALQNIAGFNTAITHAKAADQSTAALEDQRDQELDQVAKLMGVHDFVRADGTMVVLSNTGKVLVDSNAKQITYTQAGTVTANTPMSPLTVDGIDITAETTTGKIGALLSLRDTQLPNVTAELNQFTNNLFTAAQAATLETTNSGIGATNDAKHFFAGVDLVNGIDNAATIQVHPDLLANVSLLNGPAANPDPSISQALASGVSSSASFAAAGNFTNATTTTLGDYASQMLGQVANASSAATDNAKFQSNLQTSFASRASSVSGVNIDQELANLTVFQNMYAASAHVLSAVQSIFNTLMQIQ
jgi:flagellar hook-associated protein FlgK